MTVNELVKEVECKYPNKEVGNHVAFAIWNEDKEIYFQNCGQLDTNLTDEDINNVFNRVMKEWEITNHYGNLTDKLFLCVEVL